MRGLRGLNLVLVVLRRAVESESNSVIGLRGLRILGAVLLGILEDVIVRALRIPRVLAVLSLKLLGWSSLRSRIVAIAPLGSLVDSISSHLRR